MAYVSASGTPVSRWLWPLFWLLWIGLPLYFGWFFADRIACTSCFRDVLIHSLAILGYIVSGGVAYSLSKPIRENAPPEASRNGYMLGTREDVLTVFLLGGAIFGLWSFFSIYDF